MRLAYMDEAGNTGRRCDDPNQPVHLILTLVVDEVKVTKLHSHIREMAQRHCPDDCENYEFEFHGQDLFSGRGSFAGRTPSERVEIFDDVLKGISLADAKIIVRGIHKLGLQRRKYPTQCCSTPQDQRWPCGGRRIRRSRGTALGAEDRALSQGR